MSDGPHKSLPMRRHWKDLSERASKPAWSADEVCEALPLALKRDFFAEAPLENVRDILGGGKQASLFSDDRLLQLEAARQTCPSVVGSILINCAIEAAASGLSGDAAYQSALKNALEECTRGASRSMEEHWQRESSARNARFLRDRLDAARRKTNFSDLAADIATQGRQRAAALQLPKHVGIDQGPAF